MAKEVVYQGKVYRSLKHLADELGLVYTTLIKRVIKQGYSIEEAVKLGKLKVKVRDIPIEVFGKKYENLMVVAKRIWNKL